MRKISKSESMSDTSRACGPTGCRSSSIVATRAIVLTLACQ
jgi:hypothetical protein